MRNGAAATSGDIVARVHETLGRRAHEERR